MCGKSARERHPDTGLGQQRGGQRRCERPDHCGGRGVSTDRQWGSVWSPTVHAGAASAAALATPSRVGTPGRQQATTAGIGNNKPTIRPRDTTLSNHGGDMTATWQWLLFELRIGICGFIRRFSFLIKIFSITISDYDFNFTFISANSTGIK